MNPMQHEKSQIPLTNLHYQSKSLQTSLVDLAWLMIVGTTSVTNSSNSAKVKFIKVQINSCVMHSVAKMSQVSTFGSMD
jgi:hypothetical protein